MHPHPTSEQLATVTSTTLLAGLADPANDAVWSRYVERYRPVILGTARRAGLSAEDAEDATQAALVAFAEAYRGGRYERAEGRLRHWLFGIVRRQVANARRAVAARDARVAPQVSALLERAEAADELEPLWEREWRDALLRECFEEARRSFEPRTLRAFELTTLEGRSAEEAARELGLGVEAVYSGKRRVLRRMRALLPLVEEVW